MFKMIRYNFVLKESINSCVQVYSNYNPFSSDFSYKNDIYYYGSKQRKLIKDKYNLSGIVEDHHIIPKSFEKHKLISETRFPIHCSKNIKMMPSVNHKCIHDNILVHTHHYVYNLFIKEKLDEIDKTIIDNEEKRKSILLLIDDLNTKLNYKNNIPWN